LGPRTPIRHEQIEIVVAVRVGPHGALTWIRVDRHARLVRDVDEVPGAVVPPEEVGRRVDDEQIEIAVTVVVCRRYGARVETLSCFGNRSAPISIQPLGPVWKSWTRVARGSPRAPVPFEVGTSRRARTVILRHRIVRLLPPRLADIGLLERAERRAELGLCADLGIPSS
jgi:hypothetical protein